MEEEWTGDPVFPIIVCFSIFTKGQKLNPKSWSGAWKEVLEGVLVEKLFDSGKLFRSK